MTRAGMHLLMTADAVGGVWQYAVDLTQELSRRGVRVSLTVFGPAPTAEQLAVVAESVEIIQPGLSLDWLADEPEKVAAAGEYLASLAGSLGADVVQVNSPALNASADFPVPVLAVQHSCLQSWWTAVRSSTLPADFRWRHELTRRGLRRADVVVAPSRAFAAETESVHGLDHVFCVHNGRQSREVEPLQQQEDALFTAGRLWDDGKNLTTLDDAAEDIPVPVVAAGHLEGPHGDRRNFPNLDCCGYLTEAQVAARLARRPIFASAALYEPFGLAVLEAAQAGCPLLLSSIPTFRELWEGAAVLVDPTDAKGFAHEANALLADRDRRARLGRAAAARAKAYKPEKMAEGMLELYLSLKTPREVAA